MNKDFGVIFDMDGVLIHSNPAHKENIQLFCEKYDRQISEEQFREDIYGRPSKDWIPNVFEGISQEDTEQLIREKGEMYRDTFDPQAAVIPGVLSFLDELKSLDIKTVLATSATKENMDFILSELSIESCFNAVLNSDDVERGKPEPEVYLKASRAIGYDPGACIIFEDSISGVEAGKRAGAKVIGVTSTHTAEEMATCDLVIDDFTDLPVKTLARL